jgi:hypothetical protein
MKIVSLLTVTRLSGLAAGLVAGLLCGTATFAQSAGSPWAHDTATIGELMANPAANAILVKNFPDIVKAPPEARDFTLAEVRQFAPQLYTAAKLAALDAELRALPPRPMPVKVEAPAVDEWLTWGYDPERSGWNRAETTLNTKNVEGPAQGLDHPALHPHRTQRAVHRHRAGDGVGRATAQGATRTFSISMAATTRCSRSTSSAAPSLAEDLHQSAQGDQAAGLAMLQHAPGHAHHRQGAQPDLRHLQRRQAARPQPGRRQRKDDAGGIHLALRPRLEPQPDRQCMVYTTSRAAPAAKWSIKTRPCMTPRAPACAACPPARWKTPAPSGADGCET